MSGFSFDRERIHMNVARLKKGKDIFEVVIDPDLAMDFRLGKSVSINDVMKDPLIFTEARKGLRASEHKLQEIFGTTDASEIAKLIVTKGEVQETAEHRAKLVEEKRKKIIGIIHRHGVDPRNHLPHPIERIDRALDEAKVKIDNTRTAEEQIDDIMKLLRVILPIRFETKQVRIRIPALYAAKSYGGVKAFGTMLKDEWMGDGSWVAVIEMPAGMEPEFYEKVNAMTHGNVETEVIGTK